AEDDIVLIHDAARPLVSPALIQRVIAAVKERGAVVPVISVSDTVKKTVEGRVVGTVDRKELALAQTPQGFRAGFLKKAYAKVPVSEEVTDEAKLLELAGLPVFTVEGEKNNIKITTPEDLLLAECFLTMDLNKDYI
ncbi:MAG: 2-C-methyl-D-erythritol 4-phosphate cytidylyltransferase, partial [Deltaproteobacteria bacterium]|nr:2-C-methyl-D-erythritol 4-phosphate cytidylyltransferase [Deltaproteobacteria bacterium]